MTTTCIGCGSPNDQGARFCVVCGRALEAACSVCGREVSPDDRFCPACGRRLYGFEEVEERKLATVLFADVTGFTALGEALDPEILRDVMSGYFSAMRGEVDAAGGSIEKFIGDAVVAVFGVPQAGEDDVIRALRCALAMRRRLEELNDSLARSLGVRLQMRIGVNTGEVLARAGGRPEEGIVTGDVVTVAARLEQLAEPGRIVVADRTARAAHPAFDFVSLGSRVLKGRQGPVQAHELLAESQGRSRVGAESVPFVDREVAIAELLDLARQVREEGLPRLVVLTGDPGSGKSRLAEELARLLLSHGSPPRVLRGRCRPPTEAGAYAPLGGMLKAAVGVLDTDSASLALERLRVALTGAPLDGEDADRAVAALAWSIALDDEQISIRDLPPRQVRYETHRAWRTWLGTIIANGPCLLLLEDIHWADPALLDLLEELVERLTGPLLLVCTARHELSERAPGWGRGPRGMRELPLDPLPAGAAAELVRALSGGDALSQDDQRRITTRAEGNPFFIEELVHSLVEPETRVTAGRLPDTVLAVLASRIDRLEPIDKRTLQFAAVAGRTFGISLLASVAGIDRVTVEAAVSRLVDRSLLVPAAEIAEGEPRFAFKHALTQQVGYESLPRRARARAHARVARWLEGSSSDRRGESLETLAHHDEAAHELASTDPTADQAIVDGLRARAFGELLAASDDARARFTLDAALSLAERALRLAKGDVERADALESLGEAYLFAFWGDRAWATLREAALTRQRGLPDDHTGIARLCAAALETPMRWGGMTELPAEAQASALLALGLDVVGEADSKERAQLLIISSMWPRLFGDVSTPEERFRSAREEGKEAASMARRLDLPDLESAALDCVGTYWYARGLYGPMAEVTARRLALVPSLRDPREVEDVHAMAAWVSFHRGLYREAFELADEGVRRTVEVAPTIALHSLEWRVLARFRLGDWDGLMEDLALAHTLAPRREDESRAGFRRRPWAAAALVEEIRGDPAAADRQRDEMTRVAFDVVEEIAQAPSLLRADGPVADLAEPGSDAPWTALLLARRGRTDEALALVNLPAMAWHHDSAGIAQEVRCEIVALAGAWDEAATVVKETREIARIGALIVLPAFADRLEGRAALAAGNHRMAVDALHRASAIFESAGARWEWAVTQLDLAEGLAADGRMDQAREAIGRSRPVLQELDSLAESRRADDLLAGLGRL